MVKNTANDIYILHNKELQYKISYIMNRINDVMSVACNLAATVCMYPKNIIYLNVLVECVPLLYVTQKLLLYTNIQNKKMLKSLKLPCYEKRLVSRSKCLFKTAILDHLRDGSRKQLKI